jgi:prepilin-type N-terminal cleavage/methylation domain-containing protein
MGRGGFTLVELAVALLIGALLVTVVFQMMSGQARLTGTQSAREETQQNTRGALEIMSSELRAGVPAGILEASPQAITFMQPRTWGVLCADAAGAATFTVAFPDVGADAAWAPGRGNGVLVQTGAAAFVPSPAAGLAGRAWIQASQEVANNAANCPARPQGNVKVVQLTTSVGVAALQGSPVAVYALTRYEVATVDRRLWLHRNNGVSGTDEFLPQPLAGPLAANRFNLEYRTGAGAAIPAANLAANLANIRQVRIRVVTESTQRMNGTAQRDSGETVVTLRNTN